MKDHDHDLHTSTHAEEVIPHRQIATPESLDGYGSIFLMEKERTGFYETSSGLVMDPEVCTAIESLMQIERFVQSVLGVEASALQKNKHGEIRHPRLKGWVNAFKGWDEEAITKALPHYEFSPNAKLFFSVQAMYPPASVFPPPEYFDLITAALRKYAVEPAYRSEHSRRARLAKDNHRSVRRYFDGLFERFSRILVVRIDLAYREHAKHLSLDEVMAHKRRLHNNIRHNKRLGSPIGYVFGLEYGLKRGGYHFHCLFFFDGHRARQDISLADLIGKYWSTQVTDGQGRYFNCNKILYKRSCTGQIDYYDAEKRQNLDMAAAYITKKGFFLALKKDGVVLKARTFFKGELPQPKSARGRPRKSVSAATKPSSTALNKAHRTALR